MFHGKQGSLATLSPKISKKLGDLSDPSRLICLSQNLKLRKNQDNLHPMCSELSVISISEMYIGCDDNFESAIFSLEETVEI